MTRALLIYWEHPYNAVQWPMFAVGDALREQGCRVDLLNIDGDHYKLDALRAGLRNYDFAIGFGPPSLKRIVFSDTYRRFGDVFWLWEVDPFIYSHQRFRRVVDYFDRSRDDRRLRFLVPDRSYGRLLERLTAPGRVHYFPFGAFGGGEAIAGSRTKSRRFVVYATLGQELAKVRGGDDEIFAETNAPEITAAGIARLRQRLDDPKAGINVAAEFLEAFDLPVEALLRREITAAVAAVDSYEKNRRRYAVCRDLLDQGLELDFYGMGWEVLADRPGARIMGLTDKTLMDLLPDYMGIVNFDPNWNDGYHDRVYTGLACGARVLATPNSARADALDGADEDIVSALFDYDGSPQALADRIEDWSRRAVSPEAAAKFYRRHGWSRRVADALPHLRG